MRHYRRHVAEDQGREEVFWEDLYGGIWQVYKFAPWHTKLCSKWWWQCLKLCHPTVEDWMLVYGIRWRYQRGWQAKSATLLAVLHSHFQGFHFINNACKSVNFSISIFLHYPLGCLISSSGEDSSMCMVYLAEMSHYICICKDAMRNLGLKWDTGSICFKNQKIDWCLVSFTWELWLWTVCTEEFEQVRKRERSW